MKATKYILLLLLLLIIGFSIYIAVQPNSFEITRTETINAPKAVVYNNVIDFKNWESWSSWVEEHPDATIKLSEKTKGIGSTFNWQYDNKSGVLETTDTNPNSSISQDMQFGNFPQTDVQWHFDSQNDKTTTVTWTISGENLSFKFKLISAFTGGIEKKMGPILEKSLTNLDRAVQAEMKVYSITIEGLTQHSGGYYLYNTTSSKFSDLDNNSKSMLAKVGAYAIAHNITMAGKPFVLFHKRDKENDAVIFSSCIPTNSRIISEEPDVLTGKLESFETVKTVLNGDYSNLKEAWEATLKYISDNNLEAIEAGPMLETYLTMPENYPNPADWKTEIYIAVKRVEA